ncbi:MAG TPA: hypothetical protein VM095_11925 [Pyrinomonadaceae bacterium]|nr:hypothetical protein [Pyrinomonadaceae bacterium]
MFDEPSASSQAPTAYDLNRTVTDPFDPEATVTRTPDLNKTIAAAPTSEIRSKDTGPASAPPQASTYQPTPPQSPPTPSERAVQPTIAFNQSPPLPPPPQQHQPPQQPYYPPPPAPPAHTPPTGAAAHVPPPQQQQAQPQQYAPAQYQPSASTATAAAPRKKSSRAPLIIGLVVVLLLGGAAAWYFLIYKKNESKAGGNANANANAGANANANTTANANDNSNTTANANTTAPPPSLPPPNSVEFVNSSANLDGKLAENYSDFSFYYPNTWEKDPKTGVAGAGNFIRVERRLPPDFTQENFGVSWYESKGTFEADSQDVFPKLIESSKTRFSKAYPEFKLISEGETTINGIKGHEFRFQSVSRGTEKGDITLWGRVVFLPPGVEGKKNGVQLLMLTTSLAPELSSADDVGVKGELPMILNSFKMGSK